jgi:hypothetical protein
LDYFICPYRCLWQIHSFKYQTHWIWQLDDFSTHQTQLLVIIQYSVHVLNPQCIDWSIKYDPFTIRSIQGSV